MLPKVIAKICVLQNLYLSELQKIPLSDYRTWSESNNNHKILGDRQNLVHYVPNSSSCAWCILLYLAPTESQQRRATNVLLRNLSLPSLLRTGPATICKWANFSHSGRNKQEYLMIALNSEMRQKPEPTAPPSQVGVQAFQLGHHSYAPPS